MEYKMSIINIIRHKYAASEQGARDLVKSCIACAVMDVALMLPVGLMYFLVKDIMENSPLDVWGYVWKIGFCLMAIAAMEYVKYKYQFITVYKESGRRRISLAEKLRRLPLSYFGKKDLADLTSTIMADAATIETGTSHWVPELIGSMISTTLIGISLFLFDWRMALAAVWVIPIAISIVLFSAKVQNRYNRNNVRAKVDLAEHIQEGLEVFQDIRANEAEGKYLNDLEPRIDIVEKRAVEAELGVACFVVSGQMILKLGIATVALAGAWLLSQGSLDVLTFFMFLLVASRLYDPMSGSLINLGAAVSLGIQCERMDEILCHEEQRGTEMLTNKGYDVEFKDVHFAYDTSETVLSGVTFTARQGEVTALIGPSGSGKTTVSRLASRFWDIPSGTITVGGMDVSKIDPETLMNLYSIVFQDVTLFDNTVLENIRIGRKDATDEEVIAAAKLANADGFIRKLPQGYDTKLTGDGANLSQGQRQLLAIARAAIADPPALILDEATSSIDTRTEKIVQDGMDKLMHGRTTFVIAHRLSTIRNSDCIMVMENGRIIERGNHDELIAEGGKYYQLYTGKIVNA
jgi:ATP-binding cassette subfamily B protein